MTPSSTSMPSVDPSQGDPAPGVGSGIAHAAPAYHDQQVPRVFQALVVAFVLITGEIPKALQAASFGLVGGGESAFTVAILFAVLLDIARVAPLIILARSRLGILHPLILAVIVWPLLLHLPSTIDDLGELSGLFLGTPVEPASYLGVAWKTPAELWRATALYNALQLMGLLATYAGFAMARSRLRLVPGRVKQFDAGALRILLMVLIGVAFAALLVLISSRGGLANHLADLARGRFRSLAGLGPLIVLVDFGTVCMVVWIAARPNDAKSSVFLVILCSAAIAQFISNGSRSSMFAVVMMVGVAWALRTRRVPWRLAFIIAPLALFALGALSIVRSAGEAPLSRPGFSQAMTKLREEIAVRESIAAPVPVIAAGQEITGGPLHGRTYLAAVLALVPRTLWRDKPRGPGSLYAQSFLGEVREGTSIPVGPTAEAYWNFGISGVIVVFLLYGILLRKTHSFFLRHEASPFALTFFVLFIAHFQISTEDLVLFQQQMLLLAAVYVLASVFAPATKRSRRRGLPAGAYQYRAFTAGVGAAGGS